MKFEFIGNACGIFHGSQGTKILCDPWIVDGVFDGAWYHYPPLKTKMEDLKDVDAIYLSHIHQDHYDDRFFDKIFDKNIPIFVLDHGPNFLIKILEKAGFNNLVKIKDGMTINFKEFQITLYAPFAKHPFHEAKIGNVIDSAMAIYDTVSDSMALNTNDNTPTVESCKKLIINHTHFDLVMLNYNAAGPYPACFQNLSDEQKVSEHNAILKRNMDHILDLIEHLDPHYVLPFAGAYVLGGKLAYKNKYLGTTTWDRCYDYLEPKLDNIDSITQIIRLRENDIWDLVTQESDKPYEPINEEHMDAYIGLISGNLYPYERDEWPDRKQLIRDMKQAKLNLNQRCVRYGIAIKTNIEIRVYDEWFGMYHSQNNILSCSMDERLLRRILNRKSHWNNAEIGCHIEFNRVPNEYEPDLHTALQFFHL